MRKFLFFSLLIPLLSITVHAIDETTLPAIDSSLFPSYSLVTETELPTANRYDLAQRFLGITALPIAVDSAPERQLGDIDSFYITTTNTGQGQTVQAELLAIGEHVYLWLETGVYAPEGSIAELSQRFDSEVYEFVRNLWGEEALGIDGETRLHILISAQLPSEIGGFYSSANQYPSSLVAFSNERDMLTMSSNGLLPNNRDSTVSLAAHEFQHLLFQQQDSNEESWVNEGFSVLTEHLLGYGTSDYLLTAFAGMPTTQLNSWGLNDNLYPDYGAAMLYMIYLYDRFGLEAMQEIHSNPSNGFHTINQMLQAKSAPEADIIFADWVMANSLRENGGNYGYLSLPDFAPMSLAAPVFFNLPQEQSRRLNPYSTHYYQIANPPQTLTLSLTIADTIPLYPAAASSGNWSIYSLRGDNSDSRLTHRFDLRNLANAELNYSIWYSLEDNWDYAYLSISRDAGQTWELQASATMTASNRFGRAYGIGYTGESAGWLEESLSLENFLGQEILIRFESLTDDSVNQTGIALDNIRINALDYSADFENDSGGWQSEGWIRTDNRLPLRAWLQVAEEGTNAALVTRYLADGDGTWTLNLAPETERITIALSPFAPMTTEMVDYTLRLE